MPLTFAPLRRLHEQSTTRDHTATLDHDIEVLANDMAALHDLARSFPVGVTLSEDKRIAFDAMYDHVAAQVDRLSYVLATFEGDTLF